MGLRSFICCLLYDCFNLVITLGDSKFARPQMGNAINDMHNFNSKKSIYRKMFVILVILGVFGLGLYIFNSNHDFIFSFQPYYAKAYVAVFSYKLGNDISASKNLLASIISVINRNAVQENNMSNYTVYAQSVPVLLYHGVINNADGSNILVNDFKDHMLALKKAGWQTISIEDFYKFMNGERNLPNKSFLLTFDDGRKDSYYPVDPILKALDYNAVIFVITEHSLGNKKSNFYLSENELKRMIKIGRWEIEVHTREGHDFYKISQDERQGHFYSNKLWLENEGRIETEEEFINRVKLDIIAAKNDLENELEIKVISFAYPFGDFGQNSINFPEAESIVSDIVKSVYPLSFYQVWPGKSFYFNYPNENQFLIKRIDVKSDWTADNLLQILDAGREKTLPFSDNFSDYNGWIKTWGELSFVDDSMIFSSHTSTTGSSAFLDGTYLWQNYVFKSKVDLMKGQIFSLLARYKDSQNYADCSFSGKSIKAEQIVNGERKILSELKGDFVFIGRTREVGIGVQNDVIDCYLDGKVTMKGYNLDEELNHGGIGFKTWDPQLNNSELVVKEVLVEKIK